MTNNLPILYSFRRCPYAIRARLAIAYAGIPVEIREVALRDKPEQMLAISPKGTVPVLHLPNGRVIEESLDIMQWALNQNDPGHWLNFNPGAAALITWNDGNFKYYLDRYKYADRYPQFSKKYYREQTTVFIKEIENRLMNSRYLGGNDFSLVDAAIFPFIRQFAGVDNAWFQSSGYQSINDWLEKILKSELFLSVMAKYPLWIPE
ncbi:MAG: glutathione S-transferase [Methylobacter sp.]